VLIDRTVCCWLSAVAKNAVPLLFYSAKDMRIERRFANRLSPLITTTKRTIYRGPLGKGDDRHIAQTKDLEEQADLLNRCPVVSLAAAMSAGGDPSYSDFPLIRRSHLTLILLE
jgi:hypothetical protein